GDERRGHGAEPHRERKHDEREERHGPNERVRAVSGIHPRERREQYITDLLAHLDRRDVREIVRQVVHSGQTWSEKPRYEQIIPAASSEGAKRPKRHRNAEREELANRADRDTTWLEPIAKLRAEGKVDNAQERPCD